MAADLCSNSRPLWKDRMWDWRLRPGPLNARAFLIFSRGHTCKTYAPGIRAGSPEINRTGKNEGSRYWQDRAIKAMLTGPGKIRPLMKKQNAAKKHLRERTIWTLTLSDNSFLFSNRKRSVI